MLLSLDVAPLSSLTSDVPHCKAIEYKRDCYSSVGGHNGALILPWKPQNSGRWFLFFFYQKQKREGTVIFFLPLPYTLHIFNYLLIKQIALFWLAGLRLALTTLHL